jgi:uncharacterized membrane protein
VEAFFSAVRVVLGGLFILFVPGFAWTLILYPRDRISLIERMVYSIALSIALISIAFFFCNRFLGIGINMLNSFFIVAFLIILAPVYAQLRKRDVFARLTPWRRKTR